MSQTVRARIGFLGSSEPANRHHKSFQALTPDDIDMTFEMLEPSGTSLCDAHGKVDSLINKNSRARRKSISGTASLSVGRRKRLSILVYLTPFVFIKDTVTTALRASVAVLRAFSAKRILLMTQSMKTSGVGYFERDVPAGLST
jgi:hypothetical protein